MHEMLIAPLASTQCLWSWCCSYIFIVGCESRELGKVLHQLRSQHAVANTDEVVEQSPAEHLGMLCSRLTRMRAPCQTTALLLCKSCRNAKTGHENELLILQLQKKWIESDRFKVKGELSVGRIKYPLILSPS